MIYPARKERIDRRKDTEGQRKREGLKGKPPRG